MVKKILATIIVFVTSLATALASGSFYLSPAGTYEDIRASDAHYAVILPTLYLGYGTWVRDWVFLAVEGMATTKSYKAYSDSNENNNILRMKYNYGLSLVPKVNLDDVVYAYGRAGYVRTKFTDLDVTHGAYQVGLGLEVKLNECWDIRGEADYLNYQSVDDVGSLHSMAYMLGLVYHFDSFFS